MRKISKNFISPILLTVLAVVFMGCPSRDVEPELTRTQLLTSSTWTFNSVTVTGTEANYIAELLVMSLYDDTTFTFYEDGTSLRISEDQSIAGLWIMSNHETKIIYSEEGASLLNWNIIELTNDLLKVSYVDATTGGIITLTFNG